MDPSILASFYENTKSPLHTSPCTRMPDSGTNIAASAQRSEEDVCNDRQITWGNPQSEDHECRHPRASTAIRSASARLHIWDNCSSRSLTSEKLRAGLALRMAHMSLSPNCLLEISTLETSPTTFWKNQTSELTPGSKQRVERGRAVCEDLFWGCAPQRNPS